MATRKYLCFPWKKHPHEYLSKDEYDLKAMAKPFCIRGKQLLDAKEFDSATVAFDDCLKIDPTYKSCQLAKLGHLLRPEMDACPLPRDPLPKPGQLSEAFISGLVSQIEQPIRVSFGPPYTSWEQAFFTIEELAPDDDTLVAALADRFMKEPSSRPSIGYTLGELGQTSARIGSVLVNLAKSHDPTTLIFVFDALRRAGPAVKDATPFLLEALSNSNPSVRFRGAYALSKIDPSRTEPIPIFLNAIAEEPEFRKVMAIQGLIDVTPPPTTALEPLIDLLGTSDEIDIHALRAIMRFGPKAKRATPIVKKWLTSSNHVKRGYAASALVHISPPGEEAIPIFIECLASGNELRTPQCLKDLETIDTPRALQAISDYRSKSGN